ncbi:hypothetical protein HanRHA438_Chr05g0229651 [Helianthus annuus]|uniref:Uncharacterized protein n=1 Tax=Helianthus annuus TaxID=4232 RepID=A0A251US36_HELAN|nr:uncharacterized protein LOC110941333 [Helianthus annuus]KAF5806386.1 hypothetical protein HanXRQr2_Chr05g0220791 [Helianthus annuus]KAJ0570662.1 hypothetical protein HanHA300_Chr05g0180621 [Helianthus annuus]KAJ0577557.1 hypothetical protein HanIR_Chr05g0237351 [Helianthus annuus]KAJ0585005.1 hypothetical protein HanHA89_Chr05g0195321 [Helianthus annuus]KAJ0919438.1 hypothetical protein HanRHA438_Chr05g0229651 [Helianthus annuus]
MATVFSSNFNKIWPPDLVKSTGVEERSLTAHRISEDPSRFRFRMLKQAPMYSSLKDMMHLFVLYARIVRITFSTSFQLLPIERSRHGYMLIEFQKLIMKPMVVSGRNGIQYRWVM